MSFPIPVDIDTVLNTPRLPVIDVRSPGEFHQGHIPGATNVPVFDDAERAEVGTLYRNVGRRQAMIRGMQMVGAKAAQLVTSMEATVLEQDCFVHCWRGGMRSRGFAWFLDGCGFRPQRINGGYKAFRQAAHRCFAQPRRVIILAGASGAGKTRLLGALHDDGQQVIDLEQLACHRGSAFGGIGRPAQPTVEQFENELFLQWRALNPDRPVWIECESQSIGQVFIPRPVWEQMSAAPAVSLEVDRAQRLEFLVGEYGTLPAEELALAIEKIRKRLGGAKLHAALAALAENDVRTFAEIALEYYDKAYSRSLDRRPRDRVSTLRLSMPGQIDAVAALGRMASELTSNPSRPGHGCQSAGNCDLGIDAC